MFADDKKVVSLRGKSKKEDRSAVIARAAREREERQRQRERLRAALLVQSAYRTLLDLRRLRGTLRARFDAELAVLGAVAFAPRAENLVRDLILFHQHSEPPDAGRRRALVVLLLESAGLTDDASSNACARSYLSDAARWRYQMLRLAEMCLPHLLMHPEGGGAMAAPAPTVELRAVGYLLDASGWQWGALLPTELAATLPGDAAGLAVALGCRGLHARVMSALHVLLLPSANVVAPSPLVAPLLALSIRGVHAACASAEAAAILDFARGCLCDVGVLVRVPPPLLAILFGSAVQPMLHTLGRLAPQLPQLLLTPPLVSSSAAIATAAASSTATTTTAAIATVTVPTATQPSLESLLCQARFCANLVLIVSTCAAPAEGLGLGDVIPSYVALLAACHAPLAYTLARQRPRAAAAAAATTAATVVVDAGGEAEPMEVDTSAIMASPRTLTLSEEEPVGAQRAAFEALAERLSVLGSPAHMASLWRSVLAFPSVTLESVGTATQLAMAFCELLYGGAGAAAAIVEPHPRAAAALSAVAFHSEGVVKLWELTAAAQAGWGGAAGGALLCVFCSCFSHLLIALDDHEFFERSRPFSAATLRPMVGALKAAALGTYWPAALAASASVRVAAATAGAPPAALAFSLLRLLGQLYDRDARRSYMGGPSAWFADPARQQTIEALAQRMDPATLAAAQAALQASRQHVADDHDDASGGGGGGDGGGGGLPLSELPEARRVASVLLRMPYTIPFDSRLRVLRRWLSDDREERYASIMMGQTPFLITVRREHLLRDAHVALRGLGLQLRSPLRVRFLGLDNMEEAGVGEGVAKEFLCAPAHRTRHTAESCCCRSAHDDAAGEPSLLAAAELPPSPFCRCATPFFCWAAASACPSPSGSFSRTLSTGTTCSRRASTRP